MASQAFASRSRMLTCAPSSRKRAAVAAPIPLAPPVMRTFLSFRPRISFWFLVLGLRFWLSGLWFSGFLFGVVLLAIEMVVDGMVGFFGLLKNEINRNFH